jgi:hypothetical protein
MGVKSLGYALPAASVTVLNPSLPVTQSGAWSVSLTGTAQVSGTVSVSNFPATQPVSGAVSISNLPATQAVSGSVSVSNFPATQPISGTIAATQSGTWGVGVTSLPALPAGTNAIGTVSVSNFPASQAVTGTFWQATQPVSAVTLPLPSGAATAALQQSLVTALGAPLQQGGSIFTIPSSSAVAGIVPIRTTGVSSLVLKNSAGNLYSSYSVAGNTGYILIALDQTAAPASGAAITAANIINMAPVPANGYGSISPPDVPDRFVNGCVIIASTSITTFTPPSPLPIFMRGKVA